MSDGARQSEGLPLSARLTALLPGDLNALSRADKLAELRHVQAAKAALAAYEQRVLANLCPTGSDMAHDYTGEEVAAELGVEPDTARSKLADANNLLTKLPDTHRYLAGGLLTEAKTRLLVDAVTRGLSREETRAVEDYMLARAHFPYSRFRRVLAYALRKYAPRDREQVRKSAQEARAVYHVPGDDDETGKLIIVGPITATLTAYRALEDYADTHRVKGDGRTRRQELFDAFGEMHMFGKGWTTVTPMVEVLMPYDTLQGGDTPAQLAGYGPIGADTARQLVLQDTAKFKRTIIDRLTGRLITTGAKTYQLKNLTRMLTDPPEPIRLWDDTRFASAKLERQVKKRHRHCVFPNCRRRAITCQGDHTDDHAAGGATAYWNQEPLCLRHHRMKHADADWHLDLYLDGTAAWTSPTGRKYLVHPFDHNEQI